MDQDKQTELLMDMKDQQGNYVLGDQVYDRFGDYVGELINNKKICKECKANEVMTKFNRCPSCSAYQN